MAAPRWLVLTWRLPASASSTPRVATWRSLQRLGAISLTPGSVILPYTEHLHEQLEWIAEDIGQRGGDAYVLPVTELPEADEEAIQSRMKQARRAEFAHLHETAAALAVRLGKANLANLEAAERLRLEREIGALERGLARASERDHFSSAERKRAANAIKLARRYHPKESAP